MSDVLPLLLSKVAVLPPQKMKYLYEIVQMIDKLPLELLPDGLSGSQLLDLLARGVPADPPPALAAPQSSKPDVAQSISPIVTPAEPEPAPPTVATTAVFESAAAAPVPTPAVEPALTVTIRIFSTYSTGTSVGLTEVCVCVAPWVSVCHCPCACELSVLPFHFLQLEFLDDSEALIPVDPEKDVLVSGCGGEGSVCVQGGSLPSLFNRHPQSNEEAHMWCVGLPSEAVSLAKTKGTHILQLTVCFPPHTRLSKLVLWNYNRSVLLSSIGVKEVEVLVGGVSVWKGVARRGSGRNGSNTFTSIGLKPPAAVPKPAVEATAVDAVPAPVIPAPAAVGTSALPAMKKGNSARRSSRGSISMWLGSEPPVMPTADVSSDPPPIHPPPAADRKVIVAQTVKPVLSEGPATTAHNTSDFAARLSAIPAAPRYDTPSTTTGHTVSTYTPSVSEASPAVGKGRRPSVARGVEGQPSDGPKSLQESWTSLEFFQRTNRGRISMLPSSPPAPTSVTYKPSAVVDATAADAPPAQPFAVLDDLPNDSLQVTRLCLSIRHIQCVCMCSFFTGVVIRTVCACGETSGCSPTNWHWPFGGCTLRCTIP